MIWRMRCQTGLLRSSGIGYWTEINIVLNIVVELSGRWRIDSGNLGSIEFRHYLSPSK